MKLFIETGQLGNVTLGMSRQEVLRRLGKPPSWGLDSNFYNTTIWKYGSIELYFPKPHEREGGLWMIFSDHFPICGTDHLYIDPWVLNSKLTVENAEALLGGAGIQYTQKDSNGHLDPIIKIQAPSQVILSFHRFEDAPAHCLTAISLKR